MSNLVKVEFIPLDITGKNYMSWVTDREMHLESMDLTETIKERNSMLSQDKAKATIFMRRHLDKCLKREYLTVKDTSVLRKISKKDLIIKKKLCFMPHMMNGTIYIFKTSRKSVITTLQ